jgi:hypothetical protein
VALGCALSAGAQPFGAAGGGFRVNTYTTGDQYAGGIGYHSPDQFMIVWFGDGGSLDDSGIFGRRYAAADPLGAEFRVNTTTADVQSVPRVSGSPSGASVNQFVVVWRSRLLSLTSFGIFGQRYGSAGPLGDDFQVNPATLDNVSYPDVAVDGNGAFVVVWVNTASYTIWGRRYSATGAPRGIEFLVNTSTSHGSFPSVAKSFSGDFVVVWRSYKEFGTGWDIVGRRFSSTGAPVGDDFLAESNLSDIHGFPSVAPLGVDAGFVVAWDAQPASGWQIFARRFDASGAPLTSAFRVNTATGFAHYRPSVAGDSDGAFTIVWQSRDQDGDGNGVYAQRYGSSGAPLGSESRVNVHTTSDQGGPRVAMGSAGSFTVTWSSQGQDGGSWGAFARHYCAFQGDANGDDAIDVADVFYLINALFAGGPLPVHQADVNGDVSVDVADVFYLINYLFAGGPAPVCLSAV